MLRSLPAGGTVGVVAPAAPVRNSSDVQRGCAFWDSHGFRVKLSPRLFDKTGYFAGDARERAADLQAMFCDPQVDAVQSLWGGYGSTQMIPHINWDVIATHPKPFIGRSDITSLHLAFARYTKMPTFYGPGLAQVAPAESSLFTQENLLKALTRKEPLGTLPRHPKDNFVQVISGGRAQGKLAGGCLWPLCKSIGTDWQPDLFGKIVFLEEVAEQPWSIDAHLTHLQQAGLLDNVAGIVIGRLVDCEWSNVKASMPSEFALEEVLESRLAHLGVPVLYRLPCGHESDTLTLPLGVDATIDGDSLSLDTSAFA